MQTDALRKICTPSRLAELAAQLRAEGKRIVHCHGCFDVVHPGHLRHLQFAREQGDVLVVSITSDDAIEKSDGTRPYVPQELRAETLAALECVGQVVIADGATAEPIIAALRPDVYIKGKEYENSDHPGFLAEKKLIEAHGGRVIYSSGDVVYSSTAILETLGDVLASDGFDDTARLTTCCTRWDVTPGSVRQLIEGFRGKRVAVVGDAISDRYVFCDADSVAGEAPVLSVRPLEEKNYLGGAAVIAAHLRALGARPHLFTTIGRDDASAELLAQLDRLGIPYTALPTRKALPVKVRYLVESQKVLKVDRAASQPLDSASERELLGGLLEMRTSLDAVMFTDFGCGAVTVPLLEQAVPTLRQHVPVVAGGVSGPRRSLMSLREANLLVVNERELRGVVSDFDRSLPTVAIGLMKSLGTANLAVTMGARGCVLFRPREDPQTDRRQWFRSRLRSEYLPTLAAHAVDPLGAGDAFLAASTLALCGGATLPQAGYLGSAAAAVTVGRIGNEAVSSSDLFSLLRGRPELRGSAQAAAG